MHATIFVNLPVADVERSRKFFADLGYKFDEDFSNDSAVTVVLGERQFAMLIQHDSFDALHPIETAGSASRTGAHPAPPSPRCRC
jgi:predicted lactoylglutathione lyase